MSSEDNGGVKGVLSFASCYNLFQKQVLGGDKARRWLATNVWKVRNGDRIIDIGCGSGTILEHLPRDISYLGIDTNQNYIHSALKKFSDRGTFCVGTAPELVGQDASLVNSADVVLCNGVLHHLSDDEALEILRLAKRLLKLKGRLLCLEATFLAHQSRLSRWLVSRDRGQHIRTEQQWKDLVSQVFERRTTNILTGLIRIPYTHIVIECQRDS